MRFIELTSTDDTAVLIRADAVNYVYVHDEGHTVVVFRNVEGEVATLTVNESPSEIKRRLDAVTLPTYAPNYHPYYGQTGVLAGNVTWVSSGHGTGGGSGGYTTFGIINPTNITGGGGGISGISGVPHIVPPGEGDT